MYEEGPYGFGTSLGRAFVLVGIAQQTFQRQIIAKISTNANLKSCNRVVQNTVPIGIGVIDDKYPLPAAARMTAQVAAV